MTADIYIFIAYLFVCTVLLYALYTISRCELLKYKIDYFNCFVYNIPTIFLHDYADELAPIMTFISQLSLDTGNIPDDWREANMVTLFKKGDRHQASSYRPLTSVSCRILEHVIHSQIMDHFDRWNILTDKQHRFRSRRSCESQLIITIDALAKSLAKGEQVDVILLDFSKAFDKVTHHRLLHQLDYPPPPPPPPGIME